MRRCEMFNQIIDLRNSLKLLMPVPFIPNTKMSFQPQHAPRALEKS
jgi:hypothetical protein